MGSFGLDWAGGLTTVDTGNFNPGNAASYQQESILNTLLQTGIAIYRDVTGESYPASGPQYPTVYPLSTTTSVAVSTDWTPWLLAGGVLLFFMIKR